MQFDEFLKQVPKLSNLELLGQEAQFLMAPDERIRALSEMDIEAKKPRWAGVMAVFYPNTKGETTLVLILRKTYKGVHSNQVGFPGGKAETFDESIKHTALRETEEEVGLPQSEINVVKKLTKLYIPPSNFWVQPFIGYVEQTPVFTKEDAEVEAILEVPLEEFLADKSVITQRIDTSYGTMLDVPAFYLSEHVVWGATAMMLSEVKWAFQQIDRL
ncbi:MAG TPA: coenzyme A pyrophosphatase [Leeuwenhoekiella sp.]|uniref:NUDIX hydrolase n=1 Tax=Leeuwenhoekiella palythoae TaxID=573501 RepID=UPI000EE68D59|nr:CoA pyrophosphatase [Leeuwenhoekiella palythoae]UBZ10091.1 CoA pyrophosphatase [Leeuwenhoekiella palythoae]HBO28688.1 coenzyme A pyrophosphatase [Leeuwenhoekiella sp.]HCQ76357.1 coenzyme A pyrophosphatase [Leeuwenhoekiella sp.]|tara:strand:+ start:5122 stop:5769 length:648 start_codon:yes stop_codon:yes gene_type:complete